MHDCLLAPIIFTRYSLKLGPQIPRQLRMRLWMCIKPGMVTHTHDIPAFKKQSQENGIQE